MFFDIRKELGQLCSRNRDGSHATQANRREILDQVARTLQKSGFHNLAVNSLKPKHVNLIVDGWKKDGLSDATMKNRMSHLRWVAEKIQKQNIIPKTNKEMGIGSKERVPTVSRAWNLTENQLAKVESEHLRLSIELQAHFGLRREEAMKFQPVYATQKITENKIQLAAGWCKGGRAREIPIVTEAQKDLLKRVVEFVKNEPKISLIPTEKKYVTHLATYEKAPARAGMKNLHGLRHAYAQTRFEALAGFKSPLAGGPALAEMSPAQFEKNNEARMILTEELGHSRISITSSYLGV